MAFRDYSDPEYKAWRKAVYKRDKHKCQMPGCNSKTRLHAHHIQRWADFPELRFVVSNGISLCSVCHESIKNLEEAYAELFFTIVHKGGLYGKGHK